VANQGNDKQSFASNLLMNQLSGGKQSHGGSSGSSSGAGKLVGALASSLFSSGKSDHQQPSNYHGGQSSTSQQSSGGFAGSVMGGVSNMFGGSNQSHSVCHISCLNPDLWSITVF
jgi:hypothetical protein